MNDPAPIAFTPNSDGTPSVGEVPRRNPASVADMQQAMEDMYARQERMEAELLRTRAALKSAQSANRARSVANNAEPAVLAGAPVTGTTNDTSTSNLLRTLLEALVARPISDPIIEILGPRN